MVIRFATWNLSHAVKRSREKRENAWRHLANLGIDVAMVQEAGQPIKSAITSIVGPKQESRDWATAVVSYGPQLRELDQPIRPSWNRKVEFTIPEAARDGTLAIAMVDVSDGQPIVAVSLYGMLRYADQSVLRAASHILPIFDTALRSRVILAGDLNIHTHSNDKSERRRAVPILGVLESFGLVDLVKYSMEKGVFTQGDQRELQPCPCGSADCHHVRTHRHPQHAKGAMANNDYMYATTDLVERLEAFQILNGDLDESWRHSDHAPMIARIAI